MTWIDDDDHRARALSRHAGEGRGGGPRCRGRIIGALVAFSVFLPTQAWASQAQVHVVEGLAELSKGELEGVELTPEGVVRPGAGLVAVADGLSGPVLALARGGDGALYAATASPGRVWKVADGKATQILETDKPLVTALLPVGKSKLVALTAPDGGAQVIDLATKKSEKIAVSEAKMLLHGAVLDDVVYAVGGGEEGVVLKLAPGAKAFTVVAKTEEAQLRSIAAQKKDGKVRLVVGGGEEGVVYEVIVQDKDSPVRALLDAAPSEVTAIALAADGTAFASAVDGEGKLSKGASARAKEDEDEDTRKKPKARKVKSAEVWRIDPQGHATVLWQAKERGAYALVLKDGTLFAGTGPDGRVVALDPTGNAAAGVSVRVKDHDEVTALLADPSGGDGLVLGTAHAAGVFRRKQGGASGSYITPPLDADALARHGKATFRGDGNVQLAVRTGNTNPPDATWSSWHPQASGASAPRGQYAQVKADLAAGASLTSISVSYLVDNRAPELDRVDLLAPGWKAVVSQREPSESRSVTFSERPFSKFLDRRGGQNPTLDERPFGKQTYDVGYRTVYAYVEDPDRDALRYRFFLAKAGSSAAGGAATKGKDGGKGEGWELLKDWSDEPFASFEASRLADGDYRVKVEVDDLLTNGPARALKDVDVSPVFVVSHAAPRVSSVSATGNGKSVRVRLDVASALPLTVVRCSAGGEEWVPLDPKDGITDGRSESFDVELPASAQLGGVRKAVTCELYDEALNFGRVDIPVT
jgi:hypothetical protein